MNTLLDITTGTITVSNGDMTAKIEGATTEFFDQATVMFVYGENGMVLPVFVSQGSSLNEVSLNKAWDKGDMLNAEFAAFNTIEGLVSTMRLARGLVASAKATGDQLQKILESFSDFTLNKLIGQQDEKEWLSALGIELSINPNADTVVQRANDGRVKSVKATEPDDVVVLAQLKERLKDIHDNLPKTYAALDASNWQETGLGGLGYGGKMRPDELTDFNDYRVTQAVFVGSGAPNNPHNGSGLGLVIGGQAGDSSRAVAITIGHLGNNAGEVKFSYSGGGSYNSVTAWHDGNLQDPARRNESNRFSGAIAIENNTITQLILERPNGREQRISYRYHGNQLWAIANTSGDNLVFQSSPTEAIRFTVYGVGAAQAARAYGNFRVDGSVEEVSDARKKSNITLVADDDLALDVWGTIRAKFFQWNHAIKNKGEDDARHHAGWMAQEIENAFIDAGLSFNHYAMLAKEPIYEERETGAFEEVEEVVTEIIIEEEKKIEIVDGVPTLVTKKKEKKINCCDEVQLVYENGDPVSEEQTVPVLDGEGKPLMDMNGQVVYRTIQVPVTAPVPRKQIVRKPVLEQVIVDYEYTLRYSQCLIMETSYLRREIERLKSLTILTHER